MINPSEITDNTTKGKETDMQKIRCPFTYSNGRACTGHIVRIEAYKADVEWQVPQMVSGNFPLRHGLITTSSVRKRATMLGMHVPTARR